MAVVAQAVWALTGLTGNSFDAFQLPCKNVKETVSMTWVEIHYIFSRLVLSSGVGYTAFEDSMHLMSLELRSTATHVKCW